MDVPSLSELRVLVHANVVSAVRSFVWNLPSRGRVELSDAGRTRWVSDATTQVDYVVLAASSSHGVMSRLAEVLSLRSTCIRVHCMGGMIVKKYT